MPATITGTWLYLAGGELKLRVAVGELMESPGHLILASGQLVASAGNPVDNVSLAVVSGAIQVSTDIEVSEGG